MTPKEFESICKAYQDQREAEYKDQWERTRAMMVAALRPHLKGQPTAKKIYPLPWDKETPKGLRKKAPKPITAEESKARFEALISRIQGYDPSQIDG